MINQPFILEEETTVNGRGIVIGWDSENKVIFYIQDIKYCADVDGNLYEFGGSGVIVGETSEKITTPDETQNSALLGVTFVDGYSSPEIEKFTGDIIYISNKPPIQRTDTQTEKLNFILTF